MRPKHRISREWQYPRLRYGRANLFTADQDDLPTHDYEIMMVASDLNGGAGRDITGFVAPNALSYARTKARIAAGWVFDLAVWSGINRYLYVYNWFNNPIVFRHLHANSVAANRIRTTSAAAVTIGAKEWAMLVHNPQVSGFTNTEWNLVFPRI